MLSEPSLCWPRTVEETPLSTQRPLYVEMGAVAKGNGVSFVRETTMPSVNLDGIVEVVQCGRKQCNHYLNHGYELLAIETERKMRKRSPEFLIEGRPADPFVMQSIMYVLGRVSTVKHVEPMPSGSGVAPI